jgi:RNA polymerase sigma factor (sigma-70 family)
MAERKFHSLLRHLHRLGCAHGAAALPDCQLLERFLAHRDEAAFEVLVRRYGPMVWGVCRRLLRHDQEAENVFQATFLVFVRKAASIGKRQAVGSWLHKVAYRMALEARARAVRRPAVERRGADGAAASVQASPADAAARRELRAVLDEEVASLPRKYRTP